MNSKEQLEASVREIARQISQGDLSETTTYDEDGPTVYDWVNECLDVEYVVGRDGDYLGARILACCGGPTIWVDTRTKEVRGYWGSDVVVWPFLDEMGLDDHLSDYWECIR